MNETGKGKKKKKRWIVKKTRKRGINEKDK